MEAIKKAKELIEKSTSLGNSYCAKRHCLWMCDEIIKETKLHDLTIYQHGRTRYWQDVKKEIEKI